MRDELMEVLLTQTDWSYTNTPEMKRRGLLIRTEIPAQLEDVVAEARQAAAGPDDLVIEGRDGTGRKSEIPWVRVASESLSPSASEGFYVVYLFSAAGDRVYLCLGQASTRWEHGAFVPRPPEEIAARVAWARQQIGDVLASRDDIARSISLDARTGLGRTYEPVIVAAVGYELDSIPSDDVLLDDWRFMLGLLDRIYIGVADANANVPGEPPPDVSDAVSVTNELSAPRRGRPRLRLSAAERRAIEVHAVETTAHALRAEGWRVRDVGATRSYDLDATKNGTRRFVEVKGTTSDGTEVVLTTNEVRLHRAEYPHTTLAIVRNITLDSKIEPPKASGGALRFINEWSPADDDLTPIAFTYVVPPEADSDNSSQSGSRAGNPAYVDSDG